MSFEFGFSFQLSAFSFRPTFGFQFSVFRLAPRGLARHRSLFSACLSQLSTFGFRFARLSSRLAELQPQLSSLVRFRFQLSAFSFRPCFCLLVPAFNFQLSACLASALGLLSFSLGFRLTRLRSASAFGLLDFIFRLSQFQLSVCSALASTTRLSCFGFTSACPTCFDSALAPCPTLIRLYFSGLSHLLVSASLQLVPLCFGFASACLTLSQLGFSFAPACLLD